MRGGPEEDRERLEELERLWLDPDWDSVRGYRERREEPPTERASPY